MEKLKRLYISLFSENSEISIMRVMSIMSLVFAATISIVGLYQDKNLTDLAILVGVFVGSAFGGKAVQKFAEVKETK